MSTARVAVNSRGHGTCQVVDETTVRVTVNIAESWVQENADICHGDSYRLQAGGGVKYFWTTFDPDFLSHQENPEVSPQDTTTYYITLEEANGCINKDTVTLNVVPRINPEFQWQKLPDCVARPQINVQAVTDSLKAEDSFFFDFGDGTTTGAVEQMHSYEEDGVYNIRLVTRREFCIYEKTVAVPVFEMFIPNVISPDQSGYNDVFTIRYGQLEGVTPQDYGFNVTLTIFNRWGRKVYYSDNYQYNWSGADLPSGTYYYGVTVDGHATCKSWLHLLK